MKIDSSFINAPFKEYTVKINWRNMKNYAAAIGDNNPYYFDDEREKGIVAHPMYVVSVTWPIIENIKEFIQKEDFPLKLFNRIIHYSEHIILYQLLRPGNQLRIKGSIAAILPHRAGTQIIQRFDAINKNNELIFTEYIGGIFRGVKCKGEAKGKENIPKIPEFNPESEKIWSNSIHIDQLRTYIYDGCADIHFPAHTSKKFAHFVGLPGIILQGTATLAYAIKEIVNKEANGNPHSVKQIACKFTGMVIPGTDIQINLLGKKEKKEAIELFFDVQNHQKKTAIRQGYVLLKK